MPDHFRNELRRIKILNPNVETFLDIGSGTGKTLISALNNGLDAHGLEASTPFYEFAVERIAEKSRLQHISFEDVEYPEHSFDAISFGVVLEHLYDPSNAIQKALRWLKPGGVIHIEVPDSRYLMSKLFNLYFWLCRTDYVVNISPMHAPFHLYEFTENSFQKNGERLGYKIAHLERYAGTSGIAGPVDKILAPVMNLTKTGMGLIVYLQKHSPMEP